jgi:hypothetical protein
LRSNSAAAAYQNRKATPALSMLSEEVALLASVETAPAADVTVLR